MPFKCVCLCDLVMILVFSMRIAVDRRIQINYYILFMYKCVCVYDGVDPSLYRSVSLYLVGKSGQ